MYNFLQHLFGGPVSKCDPCSLTEVVLSTGQHCAAWLDVMISVLALHHSQARPSGLHWPQWTTLAGLEQQYTTAFYNRATLSLSPSLQQTKASVRPPGTKRWQHDDTHHSPSLTEAVWRALSSGLAAHRLLSPFSQAPSSSHNGQMMSVSEPEPKEDTVLCIACTETDWRLAVADWGCADGIKMADCFELSQCEGRSHAPQSY